MPTEAPRPQAARADRRLSRPAACSLLAAGTWLSLSGFSPERASAQDAPPAEPTGAVREVTVRGNKADALQRASGSGSSIGQREIKREAVSAGLMAKPAKGETVELAYDDWDVYAAALLGREVTVRVQQKPRYVNDVGLRVPKPSLEQIASGEAKLGQAEAEIVAWLESA